MFSEHLTETKIIVLFGARPGTMSIIPGEVVPDGLLRGMKAMADPTRLRILRYLAQEPQTASELSKVLRLRPPTVTHHLTQLRLAGMVQVHLDPDGERKYSARYEGFEDTQDLLNRFVRGVNRIGHRTDYPRRSKELGFGDLSQPNPSFQQKRQAISGQRNDLWHSNGHFPAAFQFLCAQFRL
jgi:DNA-binding transcriptional ArsR family regulator